MTWTAKKSDDEKAEERKLKRMKTEAAIERKQAKTDIRKKNGGAGISIRVYRKAAAAPAVRSNSAVIIEKNKKEILKDFPARDYDARSNAEAFVRQVDYLKTPSGPGRAQYQTTEKAVEAMVDGATIGYVSYYDRAKYLNKIGLKKYDADKDLTDREWGEADNLYRHLMIRDGTKLYNETKTKAKTKNSAGTKTAVKKSPKKK